MSYRFLSFLLILLFTCTISYSQDIEITSDTVEASYPGGISGWRSFLEKNLKAEVPVENGAPAGYYTVLVRFVIDKEGSISDLKALSNLGYGMEKEVIRIIKASGNWIPGTIEDKPVNSYHTQPVTFVVTYDGMDITTQVPYKLFTGIDNLISVSVRKVKSSDLSVTMTNGRVIPLGDGNYKVKANDTTRRAVITVYNAKKDNKEIGAVSFEVRPQREAPDAGKPKQ